MTGEDGQTSRSAVHENNNKNGDTQMNNQRDLRSDRPRHYSIPFVDTSIGSWIVTNEDGDHALLLVKDIDAFCNLIRGAIFQKNLKGIRERVKELLDHVEFAPVKVKNDGTIKWKNGEFIQEQHRGIDDLLQ